MAQNAFGGMAARVEPVVRAALMELRRLLALVEGRATLVEGRAAALETLTAATAWLTPTLLNSWVVYDAVFAQPGYRKVGNVVEVRGLVKLGATASSVIMTLPVGYRPTHHMVFASNANSLHCDLRVQSDGNVYVPAGGSTTWTSLDVIRFSTV